MIRVAAGLLVCAAAWLLVLRQGAGSRPPWRAAALAGALDAAPVLIGFALALAATARPLMSGLAVAALAAGLSVADRVKRVVLLEPVVFADRAELLEVVRHPRLYLPFAGSAVALAAAGLAAAALAGWLAWLEPPLWSRSYLGALASAAASVAAGAACFHAPGLRPEALRRLAGFYAARLSPSRDPAADSAAFGPLACMTVHATLAAAERPGRRAAASRRQPLAFPDGGGPVVMVQAESFLDPGRLHPGLAGLLPSYAAMAAGARARGRLAVPAWGANTVRSEFAVLTGLAEDDVGLDWFNPYEAFAAGGPPLPSIARAARLAGYRTVFVHPFDLAFYGRRRVLPLLGFDELVGPRAFAGAARRGPYVADEEVARVAADVLDRCGPRVFVFAATMEAHGPWGAGSDSVALPADLRDVPGAGQLARWLWHLQGADRMLGVLRDALEARASHDGPGWLALYGDHQPSLPETFAAAGLDSRDTDYLVWRTGAHARTAPGEDIAAHELGGALVAAMRASVPARARPAMADLA